MHNFNAFSRNVTKNFFPHSGERKNPKEFKEILKDVSMKLILKDKGGK